MKKKLFLVPLAMIGAALASCDQAIPATADDFRAAQEAEYNRGNVTYRVNGNISETTLLDNQRISYIKATAIDGNLSFKRLPPHISNFNMSYLRNNDMFFEGGCTSLVFQNTENPEYNTDINLSHPSLAAYLFHNTAYFDWSSVDLSKAVLFGRSLADVGSKWMIENFIGDTFHLPDYSEDVFDTYITAMFKYQRGGDRSSATFSLDYSSACDVFTAVRLAIWMGENGYNFHGNNKNDPTLTAKRNLFREEIENVLGKTFALNLVFDYAPGGIRSMRLNLGGSIRPEANNYELDEDEIKTYEFDVSLAFDSVETKPFPDNVPPGHQKIDRR